MAFSTKPKLYSRYFNKITDHGDYLEKTSVLREKLKHEFDFLNSVPKDLQSYFPKVHSFSDDQVTATYMIYKIDTLDASYFMIEKHLFSDQKITQIIHDLFTYLNQVPKLQISKKEFLETIEREIIEKNIDRVEELKKLPISRFCQEIAIHHGFNSVDDFLKELNKAILDAVSTEACETLYYSHGDLCFSNILHDSHQLFLIDPKGAANFNLNFRPVHYELAKISHSLIGKYDLINHELVDVKKTHFEFKTDIPVPSLAVHEFTQNLSQFGTTLRTVRLIEASLFLSMIPLHKESDLKMKAFFMNAMNIFKDVL